MATGGKKLCDHRLEAILREEKEDVGLSQQEGELPISFSHQAALLHPLLCVDRHPKRRAAEVHSVARDQGLHSLRGRGRDAQGTQTGATGGRGGEAEGTGGSHHSHHEPNSGRTRQ